MDVDGLEAFVLKGAIAAAMVVPLLAGCMTIATPEKFRTVVAGSRFGKVETIEVNRSLTQVTQSFKKKSEECLNFELTSTQKPTIGTSSTYVYAIATPSILQSNGLTELHFQVKSVGNMAPEPEKGNYYLIADAKALGKTKTQVVIYRGNVTVVAEAVKQWASGNERGCPDPLRAFKG